MQQNTYSKSIDRAFLVLDILMVILVVLNLALLAFQMNFEYEWVRTHLQQWFPALYYAYLPVYENFVLVDTCFVAVFIAELCFRWSVAIYHQTYHRWFFYPFVRWYDVLGCIPIGSLRVLRVFRVVAIIIRLQRMGFINIRQWYAYKAFTRYLGILTEEVSDRVVINVLNGMQQEIKSGIPVTEKIIEDVILPRKEVLVNYLAHRVQKVTRDQYSAHQDELRESIRQSVTAAMQQNPNVKRLQLLPVVGPAASDALQQSVYDITFHTIHNIFERMASDESRVLIERITDATIEAILVQEDDSQLQKTFVDMVVHALDVVKEQVEVKQWKQQEG